MNYKLIVRSEAEAELEEAFVWYEQQVIGLGSQFLLAVDAAINSIQRNPLRYPVIYKDIRRALMRRFPYQVFFVINERKIVIIAVFSWDEKSNRLEKSQLKFSNRFTQ
jgi:hypothetical protein